MLMLRPLRKLMQRRNMATITSSMTKKKSSTKPKTPFVDISFLFQNRMRSLSADDDQKKKQEILNQLKKACVETGFFTIPIKGILPEDLIKKVYKRTDEFLALPTDIKMKYHCKKVPNARGWTPLYEEPSYQPGVISRLEGFDLARELPMGYMKIDSGLGPNVWPIEIPGFQADVYELYEETTKLSQLLFRCFAEMLGLPANTFSQHATEEAQAFMRLLTYPEHIVSSQEEDKATVGIASHTDFECFTFIHQNGEGLHLKNRLGQWVEAPVHEDRLFVMIGDMLEHWTNGVLQATEHRVMNSEKKRQSIVRFNGADGKTEIEPLSQFVSASCPSKYPRISQRKHIEEQIRIASNHLEAAKATKF